MSCQNGNKVSFVVSSDVLVIVIVFMNLYIATFIDLYIFCVHGTALTVLMLARMLERYIYPFNPKFFPAK